MKIDFSCASPASTAICVSTEKSSVVLQGGRTIDRHNYILRDARRGTRGLLNPSSSTSHSHTLFQSKPPTTNSKANYPEKQNQKKTDKKRAAKATDLISPPGSSRYLLGETSFFDYHSDFDSIPAWVPAKPSRPLSLSPDDSPALRASSSFSSSNTSSLAIKPSSSSTKLSTPALKSSSFSVTSSSPVFEPSSSSSSSIPSLPSTDPKPPSSSSTTSSQTRDQVVVLRVSLHCKGCAGKVRKHLSKMEGVTSFNIDFAAKKVTVIGDVTPLDVLARISKVKNAQFWPFPAPAPAPAAAATPS